ncbi:MAG: SPW repeat protein [Patescibacteria group bacterium]
MNFSWLQLILGLWVVISPWLLGFYGNSMALWSNVIAGVLIIILSLWELFGGKSITPNV